MAKRQDPFNQPAGKRHQSDLLNSEISPQNPADSGAGPSSYSCDYCSSRFENQHDKTKHTEEVHRHVQNLRCSLCLQVFDTEEGKYSFVVLTVGW